NMIIGGAVGGRVDFGGGLGTGISGAGGYVAKYDQFRNPVWAVRHRAIVGSSVVNSVSTDSAGNVFATGSFVGTIDFGGGAITSAGYGQGVIAQNVFVVSYSASSGQLRWGRARGRARGG